MFNMLDETFEQEIIEDDSWLYEEDEEIEDDPFLGFDEDGYTGSYDPY